MRRSLFSRAFSRAIAQLSAYDLVPPYDYVQNVVTWHLDSYLGVANRSDVGMFYIVGGYLGDEIPLLLRRYPVASVRVFEASLRYQSKLENRFIGEARVSIFKAAVSDKIGTAVFHETNLRGSGSLLQVGPLATDTYGTQSAEEFEVETVTLDSVSGAEQVDCLWIDVQGAELMVLGGAVGTLSRTRSVFVEVSVKPNLYRGSATLSKLEAFLSPLGFRIMLLGLDKENLTGNALFVRIGEPGTI